MIKLRFSAIVNLTVLIRYYATTMKIKFVEFFIYIKILHGIVKINSVTLEVVPPPRVHYTWPSVFPIAGTNPGILQPSVPSGSW